MNNNEVAHDAQINSEKLGEAAQTASPTSNYDIYEKHPEAPDAVNIPNIDLWRPFKLALKPGQIRQQTYCDDLEGEYTTIQIGLQLWFQLDDISGCAHLEPTIISQIAGPARMVTIPNAMIYPLCDIPGDKTYVRADVVEKLHAAMPREPYTRDPFVIRITKKHRALRRAGEHDLKVNASSLHGMLGGHLDYNIWSYEIRMKYSQMLRDGHVGLTFDDHDDYAIPLHLARDIAAKEGMFAGKITATLIADGGFLHGGEIDETADATLLRFCRLVPDRHGRVPIRKIWEFMNPPLSFEEWYQDGLDCKWPKDRESPDEPTATIKSAWAACVWQALDADHHGDI